MNPYLDALKCYIDSERDIKVTQNVYAIRYPTRPQLQLGTLDIIQCYLDSGKDLEITEQIYTFRYPTRRKLDQDTLRKMFNDNTITKTTSLENLTNQAGTSMSNINNIPQNFQSMEILFPYNIDLPIKKEVIMQDSDNEDISLLDLLSEKVQHINVNMDVLPSIEELVSHIKLEINDADTVAIPENNVEPIINTKNIERKRRKSSNDNSNSLCTTKKNKSDTQDSTFNNLDKKLFHSVPITYTTRLDDMNIFQINLKLYSNNSIFDKIISESKPSFDNSSYRNTGNLLKKTKDLKKFYNSLNIINNRHSRNICKHKQKANCNKINPNSNSVVKVKRAKNRYIIEPVKSTDSIIFDHLNNKTTLLVDLTNDNVISDNKSSAVNSDERKAKSIMLIDRLDKPDATGSKIVPKAQNKMRDLIVYTTSLNDMSILQKKVKLFDGKYILDEILRESKPIYKYNPQQNTVKDIDYETLKYKLQLLNNMNTKIVDGEVKVENDDDRSRLSLKPTNVSYQLPTDKLTYKLIFVDTKTYLDVNEDEESAKTKTISNHYIRNTLTNCKEKIEVNKNIACVIHNKYSKITEIYITDSAGKLIEYSKMKLLNECDVFNDRVDKIDPSKMILKLYACCWFYRQRNIDQIWLNSNIEMVQFMRTMHHCPLGQCVCCCKPKSLQSKQFTMLKGLAVNRHNMISTHSKKEHNLISRALDYRKPKNKQPGIQSGNIDRIKDNTQFLIQMSRKGPAKDSDKTVDYYAIDAKKRINFLTKFSEENVVAKFRKNYFTSRIKLCHKFNVCCKITQDRLVCDLKKLNLSSHTIKYIKGQSISTICNECSDTVKPRIKHLKLTIASPIVEHTRKYTVANLVKMLNSPVTKTYPKKSIPSVHSTVNNPKNKNPQNQNTQCQNPKYPNPQHQNPKNQNPKYPIPQHRNPQNQNPKYPIPQHQNPHNQNLQNQNPQNQNTQNQNTQNQNTQNQNTQNQNTQNQNTQNQNTQNQNTQNQNTQNQNTQNQNTQNQNTQNQNTQNQNTQNQNTQNQNPQNQNPHNHNRPQLKKVSLPAIASIVKQRLTLKCKQLPVFETVLESVDLSIAISLKEQIKCMDFCFQNGKLIASMKYIIASTSKEFESLAKLLQLTETRLKQLKVPPGTCLNFYLEYISITKANQNDNVNKYDLIAQLLRSDKISYGKSFSSYIINKYKNDILKDTGKAATPVICNVFSLNESSSSKNETDPKKIHLIGNDDVESNNITHSVNQDIIAKPSTSQSKDDSFTVLHLTSNNIIETTVESILKDTGNFPVQDDNLDQFERLIPMNVIVDYQSVVNGCVNDGQSSDTVPDLISDLPIAENQTQDDSNKFLKQLLSSNNKNIYTKRLSNFNYK